MALVVSQFVIVSAWRDAWAGTAANVVLLAVVAHGWLTDGPRSFHAQFVRDAQAGLARPLTAPVVSEADLAPLPEPVQRHLRLTGVVGQPRVRHYPGIRWESVDAHTARAQFAHGGHTIAATLFFGDDGLLTTFVSDDRSRASPDGRTFTRQRFSTPVRDYRSYGPARLAAYGEARWHLPEGEFTYGEFHLVDVSFNMR